MSIKCLMNGLEVNYPCSPVCALFGDCVTTFEAQKKENVRTNADRIRAMNDEELAVFLERSTGGCETCVVDCTCNGPEDLPAKAVCHQGVLKWLQSPAE